jgi:hypothetical protein
MRTSCGALFYSYDTLGNLGIVLGLEGYEWLPFKGCNEENETLEQTAIREINEETCGLVNITMINLEHNFTSKRKNYHIGLCEVPYEIINNFANVIQTEKRAAYKEKKKLKFFDLYAILQDKSVHNITKASVRYFWTKLIELDRSCNKPLDTSKDERLRKQSVCIEYAKNKYNKLADLIDQTNIQTTDESSSDDSTIYTILKKPIKKTWKRKSQLLRQPFRYGLHYTPEKEEQYEKTRIWRKVVD